MAGKQKQYNFALDPGKVRSANISRYSDGYSYASMSFKMADSEYMNVSYEWQGSSVPEFAMNVMEIMQTIGKKEQASVVSLADVETLERTANVFLDRAAKMKKQLMDDEEDVCEECGQPKNKCKCNPKKK